MKNKRIFKGSPVQSTSEAPTQKLVKVPSQKEVESGPSLATLDILLIVFVVVSLIGGYFTYQKYKESTRD
jgi:hypothetical protein